MAPFSGIFNSVPINDQVPELKYAQCCPSHGVPITAEAVSWVATVTTFTFGNSYLLYQSSFKFPKTIPASTNFANWSEDTLTFSNRF